MKCCLYLGIVIQQALWAFLFSVLVKMFVCLFVYFFHLNIDGVTRGITFSTVHHEPRCFATSHWGKGKTNDLFSVTLFRFEFGVAPWRTCVHFCTPCDDALFTNEALARPAGWLPSLYIPSSGLGWSWKWSMCDNISIWDTFCNSSNQKNGSEKNAWKIYRWIAVNALRSAYYLDQWVTQCRINCCGLI